ncbi:putative ABC transporter, substrate binding protein (Sugar) [Vibrio nigripulchritudo SO65]|uniref:ABC transporter substrate-binding protein n=1 Tax=Vibrio nigripulchritudo TaxID=28173 RepID=UPI0003B1EDA5|nr:extracellular solute-binding protein [Vibrio nigripulchritudo]CCN36229.1 putative ABC transporter, substrate binding protein (Sugar) [Vibrio nigripulchritudo AM115]CCN43038.1 putative ABC transporter, substrate binding protein (Sugar) [Vibrio nigripulchritudo FTn2]CCN65041.1 putative ABC transporter, substrate binding protein (Sugar) [Vibrio nigripulchritudo POn4]CCN77790.1 putative ABC transporter, substrate binding protein (Sugar) [Vibrio nigripulchritudo SO65]
MKLSKYLIKPAIVATLLVNANAIQAGEITVMALSERLQEIAERFNKKHPEHKVTVETVPYKTVVESLPVQLASGKGPDIAQITDFGGLNKFYLDISKYVDKAYFEREYGRVLDYLRVEGQDNAIFGYSNGISLGGAFVNLTLFEQAGIAIPKEGATWDEWAEAARKVRDKTKVGAAMFMDRSGHRFAALATSYGAELVNDKGMPVGDEGLRAAVSKFVEWHKDGTMPLDLWGAVGGSTHRELFSEFVNAQAVFYFGGSWLIKKMESEVGDFFEWKVIPTPCGPAACSSQPGGWATVALKNTKEPELVAQFLEFAAQLENVEYVGNTDRELPAATSLVKNGLKYPGAPQKVVESLNMFISQIPKVVDANYRYQGWRYQRAMMNALTTRISQAINGELDVNTAVDRVVSDVKLAIESQ